MAGLLSRRRKTHESQAVATRLRRKSGAHGIGIARPCDPVECPRITARESVRQRQSRGFPSGRGRPLLAGTGVTYSKGPCPGAFRFTQGISVRSTAILSAG